MAFDETTDRRIQRMSCQKVAADVMPPLPVGSKGELLAGWEKWKEVFIEVTDFLSGDVNKAGGLQVAPQPATVASNGSDAQTLDEALSAAVRIKDKCGDNDVLKSAVKLRFVTYGVKSPKSMDDAVSQLSKSQVADLESFIDKELDR